MTEANRKKKATMIVDLQFGSTGKGLIAGYWAKENCPDVVISCNMPNAGHTYIDEKGNRMVHKVLPSGIVSPKLKYVLIGPGAVFDPVRLNEEVTAAREMGYLGHGTLVAIHPGATILKSAHRETEQSTLSAISSTMQGSMAAMVHKMARSVHDSPVARDTEAQFVRDVVVVDHDEWMLILMAATKILIEGSQGYSLGINTHFYPYTTSRDCTPARFLSDAGVPHNMLERVIGTVRTFPIRVGNTPDGFSGGHYPDQRELSWEDLSQVPEKTTVTGRVRRVFTLSLRQLQDAAFYCCPDEIFLNFANYLETGLDDMIGEIEAVTKADVRYIGVGPTHGHVVDFGTKAD